MPTCHDDAAYCVLVTIGLWPGMTVKAGKKKTTLRHMPGERKADGTAAINQQLTKYKS